MTIEAPESIEVELVDAAFGGEALGHLPDGRVVFVPRALPGERAQIQVVHDRRDFARGEVLDVLRSAPGRVEAPCAHFRDGCGGCSWQHAEHALQLELKERIVADQLRRIGHFPEPSRYVKKMIGMLEPWHYRNQARFTVGRRFGELCFTYRSTHRLLRIDHCWIVHPRINAVLHELQGRFVGQRIHQVLVRVGANTGQLMVTPKLPETVSGQAFLEEDLLGFRFRLSPPSFFQVNTRREQRPLPPAISHAWLPVPTDGISMAEILALLVCDRLRPSASDLVVDAYSGVGTFALMLAPLVGEVVGIEEAKSAVRDAEHNARDASNVTFIQAKTELALPSLDRQPDAVILDPARAGAHPAVLDALLKLRPSRIVYVSCDPSTLARDLRILVDGGYDLREVQPLDMFPHTFHVECVATLVAL